MSTVQKLSKEELNDIETIGKDIDSLIVALGDATYRIEHAKVQKATVLAKMNEVQNKKIEYIQNLEQKYGQGEINLSTGEFIPTK